MHCTVMMKDRFLKFVIAIYGAMITGIFCSQAFINAERLDGYGYAQAIKSLQPVSRKGTFGYTVFLY